MKDTDSLLSPSAVGSKSSSCSRSTYLFNKLNFFCLPSRPAVLLVILAVVVGALRAIYTCLFSLVAYLIIGGKYIDESFIIFIYCLTMTVPVFLYPVSGFFADVVCGRYKVMVISLSIIIVSFVLMLGAAVIVILDPDVLPDQWSHLKIALFSLLVVGFGLTFGIGIISYSANFVQFGLDQLMEAPSVYLSMFVHWIVWADSLPLAVILPLVASVLCHDHVKDAIAGCVPFVCFISLIILLVFICWKHQWFHFEPGHHNPYKTVIKVLNFAKKHKYPLQRSAFTYCDDEKPSRLDLCKVKYGGPFLTDQVEDVKTLIKVFLILAAISPVFVLELPSSIFGLPLISVHIAQKGNVYCDASWNIVKSGSLRYIISAVVFPMYIYFMFSVRMSRLPKILTRLSVGILLYLLGVSSMFIMDLIGHALSEVENSTISRCVFINLYNETLGVLIPHLEMSWISLIPTNVLLGIGPLMVYTTALEFISAQSPHSMKGLLVGLYFMTQSLFQLLSSFAVLLFSLKSIWGTESMKRHPPVTNCGFGYLLFTSTVALVGYLLFLVAAKRYKLRQRDERPYDFQYAENAFLNYIEQR